MNVPGDFAAAIRAARTGPDTELGKAARFLAGEVEDRINEAASYRAALNKILDAAEYLSRPGISDGEELLAAARMTKVLQEAARLIGHTGVFPELGGLPDERREP